MKPSEKFEGNELESPITLPKVVGPKEAKKVEAVQKPKDQNTAPQSTSVKKEVKQ